MFKIRVSDVQLAINNATIQQSNNITIHIVEQTENNNTKNNNSTGQRLMMEVAQVGASKQKL